jgi:type I restriction enzyme S subunit
VTLGVYATVSLKRLFFVINGATPKSDVAHYWGGDVIWVTPEDLGKLDGDTIDLSRRRITSSGLSSCGTSLVPPDSIVLSTRAPIGNVAIAGTSLCTNQGCKTLVPRSPDVYPRYFYYQIQSLKSRLTALGNGTTFLELSAGELGRVSVYAPPTNLQINIANFLDRETAEADALIAKYERLISLLEEKRVAFIAEAVTSGLDPSVPTKDSGVAWLGQIPSHWETRRLKFVADLRYGLGQPPPEMDGGLPFVRATNIDQGSISETGMVYVDPNGVPKSRNALLREGEILIVRSGALTGDSAIVPPQYDGSVAGFDIVVTGRQVNPSFLASTMLMPYVRSAQLDLLKTRAAQPHLNVKDVGSVQILLPPCEEQERIAQYIVKLDTKLKKAQNVALDASALAKEHRASLVTAAVAGEIDVNTYRSSKRLLGVRA